MIRFNDIIEAVSAYHPRADIDLIQRAYVFSAKVHQGQVRLSGEPYLIHPLEVTGILTEMKLDTASIATGLLHDTLEDSYANLEEIKSLFGEEIASLVDGVTKITTIESATVTEEQAGNYRKMILAMAKDIRVVLIKLADRLHNMRTLRYHNAVKQERIAQETLDVFAPLAHRLGISWLKTELEELAFRTLKTEIHARLLREVRESRKTREKYIEEVDELLKGRLAKYGIDGEVAGRLKSYYSIYKKMEKQKLSFDQVHDVIAFRIVVPSLKECYECLGLVHGLWKPVEGRFKDYVALPKENGYQAVHTTVIGPHGRRVEVQIRTRDMHRVAEEGIASHWRYKEDSQDSGKEDVRFAWLRQLLEWQRDLKDPAEFLESVRVDLFPDEVYVFTPKGEVKRFPMGATPIDFAYSVHTEVGNRCAGARINGKLRPLRTKLISGDTVEIITSRHQRPSKDWLEMIATSSARYRIRQYIKSDQRERSRDVGRALLEREFARHGLQFGKAAKDSRLGKALEEHGLADRDALLAGVGYGKVSPKAIIRHFVETGHLGKTKEMEETQLGRLFKIVRRQTKETGVLVRGLDDILVRFARCCAPLPGEPIAGFITRGRGVTVHSIDCSKGLLADPERKIEVSWDRSVQAERPVKIQVVCVDRPGLLASISRSITSAELNISNAHCRTTRDRKAVNTFEVSVLGVKRLNEALKAIGKIKGVISVERLRN